MSEMLLTLLIAASCALVVVTILWLRERRRVAGLERELARERARRQPRGQRPLPPLPPLPPLKAVLEAASRMREEGIGEVLRTSFDDLAGWAEEADPALRDLAARDGTLTIFFSDIENSTAINEEIGDRAWLKLLGAHDQIIRRAVAKQAGHVVKSQGDGFMVAFASAEGAVRSAIGIQRGLASPPRRLRNRPIAVRIGVHTGPALEKGGDLFGRNVALAARVANEARGGEILVTSQVSKAGGGAAADLVFTDAREVELKGLPGTYTLLAVRWHERGDAPGTDPSGQG